MRLVYLRSFSSCLSLNGLQLWFPDVALPSLATEELMTLTLALLGLGGMRSFWKSPKVLPEEYEAMSEAMKALQAKVGAVADGAFGKNTANAIAKHYDLSRNRAAHLLGQAHHESGGFRRTRKACITAHQKEYERFGLHVLRRLKTPSLTQKPRSIGWQSLPKKVSRQSYGS